MCYAGCHCAKWAAIVPSGLLLCYMGCNRAMWSWMVSKWAVNVLSGL